MSLSSTALDKLKQHWAVSAFDSDDLEHTENQVHERLAQIAVGKQIEFSFTSSQEDEYALGRIGLAYEMAAIEGLDELSRPSGENETLRDQAIAASYKVFSIRRLMQIPTETNARIFFILQLCAAAHCGDRWSDLLRWFNENKDSTDIPSVANSTWETRLLYRLFDCWVRLFLKRGWDDLDQVREIIAGLRNAQEVHEALSFQDNSDMENRSTALRLAALYHWARGTEIIAQYMLQGNIASPFAQIDKHFESAIKAATASRDPQHEIILRWLHATARNMVTNSLWWATRTVNSKMADFIHSLTHREHQAMFELLPPQRIALLEQGLLDQAKTAIVVDMPTSGGKTLLAQFRIIQALNQFDAVGGWVAYVAPTRALSAQITRRLRKDFEPIGIRVEQLTAAIEVDSFEESLFSEVDMPFHVLVATPEKLSLVIRNKKAERPLALVVMDEAHNIEAEDRGLRIELLLATIKRDCPQANFLLLMPYVEESDSIARWLAEDINAGQAISLSTSPWKPNERIIGLYRTEADDTQRSGWRLKFETMTTTKKAMHLHGTHNVGGVKPLNVPKSKVLGADGKQQGLALQTAAMGTVMSSRGTSIVVANKIPTVWNMAKESAKQLPALDPVPKDIQITQDFLRTEISPNFSLVDLLEKGVGVHHAGLSDDVRSLMEWLAESGSLRVLCATTTIAQGVNFPVSSVFLQTHKYSYGKEMTPREFWNLAGRAGRVDHDSVGVIGLAEGADRNSLIEFTSRSMSALVSRLITQLDKLAEQGNLAGLSESLWEEKMG